MSDKKISLMLFFAFWILLVFMALFFPGRSEGETPSFTQYKPNYIVSDWSRGREDLWLLFSVSFKFSLVRDEYSPHILRFVPPGKLTLGYSQRSYWRILDESSPFDEHDFNPELFYDSGLFKGGYEHVSTGEAGDNSRAWDRAFIELEYKRGIFQIYIRPWYILKVASDTDNIGEIQGFGDFGVTTTLVWTSNEWYRHALQFNRGYVIGEMGVRVGRNSNWYLFLRGFEGRGYSLVRYEEEFSTISLGFALIK